MRTEGFLGLGDKASNDSGVIIDYQGFRTLLPRHLRK